MEHEKSLKKPNLARLGDLIDYKLLLLKENKKAFRITCIMLIVEKVNNYYFKANYLFEHNFLKLI